MKKRLLSILLALALAVGMLPMTAAAQEGMPYGEMPIYLGYPDVDYMAEEILKEIELPEEDAAARIRAVYDWVVRNCSSESDGTVYFEVEEVLAQAEGDFRQQTEEKLLNGSMVMRMDIAGALAKDGTYSVGTYDTNYYIAQFASRMMLQRAGNGAHFAALLAVLLSHLGYDCRLIDGEIPDEEGEYLPHKWNMVLVDGQYFWLDACLEQQAYTEGEEISGTYFMSQDASAWEPEHRWDSSYSDALDACVQEIMEQYRQYTTIPEDVQQSMEELVLWTDCSEWAEPYLKKSMEKGIFPDVFVLADMADDVTRGAFASVAVLFYEKLSGETVSYDAEKGHPFTDVDESDVDVLLAYQLGVVNGMSPTEFAPEGTLTRAQAVTMLGRVVELVQTGAISDGAGLELGDAEVADFPDQEAIGAWAEGYVSYFVSHNVVNGMPDGSFAPAANMTCEQAMKVAVEALEQ